MNEDGARNGALFGFSQLDKWVQSEDPDQSKRLSLRTSATLVAGAASLYKRKLEELLTDLQSTEESLRGPKFRRRWSYQGYNDQDSDDQDSEDQYSEDQGSDDEVQDSKSSGSNSLPNLFSRERGLSTLPSHFQDPDRVDREEEVDNADDPDRVDREEEVDNADDVEEFAMSAGGCEDVSPGFVPEHCDEEKSKTENNHSTCSSTPKLKNAITQTSLPVDFTEEESANISKKDEARTHPFVCGIIFESGQFAKPAGMILSAVNPECLTQFLR